MKKIFLLFLLIALAFPSIGGVKANTPGKDPVANLPTEVKNEKGQPFSGIGPVANINNVLYFTADGGLYKYTTSDKQFTLLSDQLSYFAMNLTEMNGEIFFMTETKWPNSGTSIWKTNGTPEGTVELFKTGYGDLGETTQYFKTCNNKIFYPDGDFKLRVSNGTVGNNAPLLPLSYGSFTSFMENSVCSGNKLYFPFDDGVHGWELWRTDGTNAGTVMVKDIRPGASVGDWWVAETFGPKNFIDVNGTLYFTANNNVNGRELWKTNGTSVGTVMVKDIFAGSNSSTPSGFTKVNNQLYFSATDGSYSGYWKTDGTSAGTAKLTMDPDVSITHILGSLGSTFYFSGYTTPTDKAQLSLPRKAKLWKSDGTRAGTVLIKDINPTGVYGVQFNDFVISGGIAYFYASSEVYGWEPWRSDGTSNGTYLIKDFCTTTDQWHAGTCDFYGDEILGMPTLLTVVNGIVFLVGHVDPDSGQRSLWQYNTNANVGGNGVILNNGYSGICIGGSKKNPARINLSVTLPVLTASQLNLHKGKFIDDGSGNIFYIDPKTRRLALIDGNNVLEYLTKIGIGVKNATLDKIANLEGSETPTPFSKRYANTVLLQIQNKCILWYVNADGKKTIITDPLGLIDTFAVKYLRWKNNWK